MATETDEERDARLNAMIDEMCPPPITGLICHVNVRLVGVAKALPRADAARLAELLHERTCSRSGDLLENQ